MLVVAGVGLVVNLVAFALLREGAKESLNVEGAYLEVLADTVGSVGVIVAAVVIAVTGWDWVDPVVGVAIGLWILPRTWRLGGQALRILVQAAPPGIDLDGIERRPRPPRRRRRRARPARLDPDLGDGGRLRAPDGPAPAPTATRVLDQARDLLAEQHHIDPRHPAGRTRRPHAGCDEVAW